MSLFSPNELLEGAKTLMLDGREPQTEEDWVKVVNFFAHNIAPGQEVSGCIVLKALFKIPLDEMYIADIAKYQRDLKQRRGE